MAIPAPERRAGKRRVPDAAALPPILYEDAQLIAFDKPAGLLVAPDRWDKAQDHLMRRVHERCSPATFNAHRLDRDTSGVLLCAKDAATLRALVETFATQRVSKRYLALTVHHPPAAHGTIEAALAPDGRRPGRMRVVSDDAENAKRARTEYTVLEHWRTGHAWLSLEPQTGRTHQLRVHLAHLGCPIVADPWYGDGLPLRLSQLKGRRFKSGSTPERPLIARLALHAAGLSLAHPVTGVVLRIEAPLPADLELALKALRRHAV